MVINVITYKMNINAETIALQLYEQSDYVCDADISRYDCDRIVEFVLARTVVPEIATRETKPSLSTDIHDIIEDTPLEWDNLYPKLKEWAKSIAIKYAASLSSDAKDEIKDCIPDYEGENKLHTAIESFKKACKMEYCDCGKPKIIDYCNHCRRPIPNTPLPSLSAEDVLKKYLDDCELSFNTNTIHGSLRNVIAAMEEYRTVGDKPTVKISPTIKDAFIAGYNLCAKATVAQADVINYNFDTFFNDWYSKTSTVKEDLTVADCNDTCVHQNEEICNTCPDLCCGIYLVPAVEVPQPEKEEKLNVCSCGKVKKLIDGECNDCFDKLYLL